VATTLAGEPAVADAKRWARYLEAFLDAHRRDGWYEAESPGYLGISMTALLLLADHAPDDVTGTDVRRRAREQLDVLFAAWAQLHVGGYPAGAKSRGYVHWVLGNRNVPWPAWAWLLAGIGRVADLSAGDYPDLAASAYRPPSEVIRLLAERREQPPYEVRQRRVIELLHRRSLDAALYSYATPDFILSTAQALGDSRLGVSGGEEVMVTLYPEGERFAPLYVWSRSVRPGARRWASAVGRDLAVGRRDLVLARVGDGGEAVGNVYFGRPGRSRRCVAPPCSRPTATRWSLSSPPASGTSRRRRSACRRSTAATRTTAARGSRCRSGSRRPWRCAWRV
jgi:hypothetical protein